MNLLCCHEPILPRFSKYGSFPPLSEKNRAPQPHIYADLKGSEDSLLFQSDNDERSEEVYTRTGK